MAKKKTSGLSQAAREMGKKGGKRGGPARAKALNEQQRVAIAKKGAAARHGKK